MSRQKVGHSSGFFNAHVQTAWTLPVCGGVAGQYSDSCRVGTMCAAASDDTRSQEIVLWSIVALCAGQKRELLTDNQRKEWCKQWLARRSLRGSYAQIFSELELENPLDFENSLVIGLVSHGIYTHV